MTGICTWVLSELVGITLILVMTNCWITRAHVTTSLVFACGKTLASWPRASYGPCHSWATIVWRDSAAS